MSASEEAMKRETVSLTRAAELAGVSRRTVYNWIADGKISGVRTAGGSIRIFVDTIFLDIGQLPKKSSPRILDKKNNFPVA